MRRFKKRTGSTADRCRCGAIVFLFCWLRAITVYADTVQPDSGTVEDAGRGYKIEEPGTITFTVGVKISGKVEKPQVVIFLLKEKTLYRNELFERSFYERHGELLPFTPIVE